jgi:hypothetical protein
MSKLRTSSWFPVTLPIDGAQVSALVKRLTLDELDAYETAFLAWDTPRGTAAAEESAEAKKTRESAIQAWMRGSFGSYLKIAAGECTHDETPIVAGDQFFDVFCGRQSDVIPLVLVSILTENKLSEAQKKTSKRLLDSAFGSTSEPTSTTLGSAPASTADSAALPNSADAVAATEPSSEASSGMTTALEAATC